jgi:hypothetical protein
MACVSLHEQRCNGLVYVTRASPTLEGIGRSLRTLLFTLIAMAEAKHLPLSDCTLDHCTESERDRDLFTIGIDLARREDGEEGNENYETSQHPKAVVPQLENCTERV